jgi:hypothetical protein
MLAVLKKNLMQLSAQEDFIAFCNFASALL